MDMVPSNNMCLASSTMIYDILLGSGTLASSSK